MEDWCCKIKIKQKEFEARMAKLELNEKGVESKIEGLGLMEKRVAGCINDVELQQMHFDSIQKLIEQEKDRLEECEKHLGSVFLGLERKERELQMKQQQIDSVFLTKERELVQKSKELESKESQLENQAKDIESKHHQIGSIIHLFQTKQWQIENQTKEVEFKHPQNDSISQILHMKEVGLDWQAKELEVKQQQNDSVSRLLQIRERNLEQQAMELELKQCQIDSQMETVQFRSILTTNNDNVPSSAHDEFDINGDGIRLQFVTSEQLKRYDSVRSQTSAALQASLDPGKLVLDAMQGFYPSNSNPGNREIDFDLRFIKRSCILLLHELDRMSPQISPNVREEAFNLSADWNAKMTIAAENSLDVLGFLRLVTAFELTSNYDTKELQRLLALVTQPEQAAELSRAIGVKQQMPAINIISSVVKLEKPDSPVLDMNASIFSPLNLQPDVTMDATDLSGFMNEPLSGNHSVLAAYVQFSSDPAKLVLNSMQKSLAQYLGNGKFEESVMSCNISLLKELMRVIPHVGPHLTADATILAVQWRSKMKENNTENSMESLGFLLYIATYGLLSTLDINEIVKLLGLICQHKPALDLCQTCDFADKIAENIEKKQVKQHIEAVRFIFVFKLIDKLPPLQLLNVYAEDIKKCSHAICRLHISLDEKEMVADGLIGDLRAVNQYMNDYNLESEFPSADIELHVKELERLKVTWRHSVPSVEQSEQRKRKKPNSITSAPE